LLSGFPTKILHAPFLCPIRDTYPTHFIFLDLLIRILLGKSSDHEAPYAVFSTRVLPRYSCSNFY
jgi:hypothetical protein